MNLFDFNQLFSSAGGYSLPILIQLKHPEKITWYFTSNSIDIQWDNLYKAVPMNFKFPNSQNGVTQGGTLEIDIDQQHENIELLKWFDELDDKATIDVVALINEQGNIVPIGQIVQNHGSVTWDGEKIGWQTNSDDRFNMQTNAWIFDQDALTGTSIGLKEK